MDLGAIRLGMAAEARREYKIMHGVYSEKSHSEEILGGRGEEESKKDQSERHKETQEGMRSWKAGRREFKKEEVVNMVKCFMKTN